MAKVRKTRTARTLAGVSAIALGLTGVLAASGAAFAATPSEGTPPGGATDTGSLIIHKYEGAQGMAGNGKVPTGTELNGKTPLGGVDFEVWQVGTVNAAKDACVATNAFPATVPSLETVKAYPKSDFGTLTAGDPCLVQVGADWTTVGTLGGTGFGSVTVPNLAQGLYLVNETDSSGAVVNEDDGNGNAKEVTVVSEVADFLVTIPYSSGSGASSTWVWDVNVYPKNQVLDAPIKTVTGPSVPVIGQQLTWSIAQTVPALNQGETYTSAVIWDKLVVAEQTYVADSESLSLSGAALTEGVAPTGDYVFSSAGGELTWTLTSTGLGKIAEGDTLTAAFKTTVVTAPGGSVGNPGEIDPMKPGYGSDFNGTKKPGGTDPYTYWGVLKVTKVKAGTTEGLAGATFEVYERPEASEGVYDACPAAKPSTGLVSTGTSGTGGVVNWTPNTPDNGSPLTLWVAEDQDGTATPATAPTKDYCLYETQAPSGFTASTAPVTVTITAGNALTTGDNDRTIENTPISGPELPLTGAGGTMLLVLGGLGLVAVAFGAHMVIRNRQKQNA